MGARKINEQHIRNITQNSSGSYQISLPKNLVAELKWRQGQKITVVRRGSKLLVQDWAKN